VAFAPDGGRVLLVERSTSGGERGRVRLTALGATGDTLWTRSHPYDPQQIPQAELDSLYAPRIESLQQFARLEGSLTEVEAEQAYRASVAAPGARPPVNAAHVGLDGRIWLAWAGAPGQTETWWVLDPEGRQIAAFDAPHHLDVRGAGADFLWAVETVGTTPTVVRYRVGGGEH
jgi:hypothetical protein